MHPLVHGLVRGLVRYLCCSFLLLAGASSRVHADGEAAAQLVGGPGINATQLGRYAAQLGSSDNTLRAAAAAVLSHIPNDAWPAVEERWRSVAAHRPAHDDAVRVMSALRHAVGSRRADDDSDLAPGILPVLEHERSAAVLAMLEPLLYLRALEASDDPQVQLRLARWVTLDDSVWDNELRLSRKRMGMRLLPALLVMRSHETPDVRRFGQAGVVALGMTDPKLALTTSDPYLLAAIVRAYGNPPDFDAMPTIVRMVSHEHFQVRQAARATLARFGKNAIWQVRELYGELAGQPANKAWDFERCASELYAVVDRDERTQAQALLQRGLAALQQADLVTMKSAFDALLGKYPELPERAQLAPGYAALGAELLERDELSAALDAYRRALRLAPDGADHKHTRAQIEYLSAELALTQGVVDLAGYDRALAFEPEHALARAARDRLSGEHTRRVRQTKRWAAAAALLVLCMLSVLALRKPKPNHQTTPATEHG